MKYHKLALSIIMLYGFCSTVQAAEQSAVKKTPEIYHGTSELPPSRQYYCYSQQDYNNGSSGIKNAACKEAYENAGEENWERARIFDNWNTYSQNLSGSQYPDKPKDLVPDGKLCSAGKSDFDSINPPSNAWHTSNLEVKDGRVQLTYIASQMHDPSEFRVFLTDQDHLTWDSLKESPDVKVKGEPDTDNIGPGRYYLDVKLPEGYVSESRSLLYIMWERNEDPARETFFSCSDVVLKETK
ncbi:lytic polysaccharide monooxygenase [Pseudomonas mucidolens]|uniref:Chitin-binding protein n=1 Tax=Pseudomonas mucidolens TaxID=46679 RepID=A0A1H2MH44_9PSED|nr:lytic polysaccharide monooxygenase [Pseudomonas mucidolens]SDU92404.1 chitin-binding protein [Pseudomonas mucidolens]SQH33892.1 chitin binding domain-containing protein [Pseudomonas mucidolens]